MTSMYTKYLCAAITGVAVLSSCSRPVAHFQRGPAESFTTSNTQTVALPVQVMTKLDQPTAQVNTTIEQAEAYVSTERKLATKKVLSKRMVRLTNLLASTNGTLSPSASNAPHKMNLMERIMIKKLNKQVRKQLAPNHPEKAMISTGKLIGASVLLIGGLIMLIAGTGTVAFIGLILSLIGALGVLVSVFGI